MSLEHRLTIRAVDPTAEITVYNSSFNRVGRGVGGYNGVHRDGLYEIRVRAVSTQEVKLISLARDETVDIGPVAFASPVPLVRTATGDDTHQAAVLRACLAPVALGAGSGLLVAVRDRPAREPQATSPTSPATGLSIADLKGTTVFDLAPGDPSGDSPVAAVLLHVNPGVYRLRLHVPDEAVRERALVAAPGWVTGCFMVRRPIRKQLVADLAQGSLLISRLEKPFTPDDALARLSEAARDALTNDRRVTEAVTKALLEAKFQEPMLGLLVGHLLLRDRPDDPILQEVVKNLVSLLGWDHPDVQALTLATSHAAAPQVVTAMPMLRASWDAIVTGTVRQRSLIPPGSLAADVATRVLPTAPWLVWEAPNGPATRQTAIKMAALRSYVRGAAELAPVETPQSLPSSELPESPQSLPSSEPLETPQPLPPSDAFESPRSLRSSVPLDADDREKLAQSLGVPSSILDEMLSKLDG
jgi:hypothetical protein